MHSFTFNGHSSDEFGIRIERFPDLNRSERKYKSASVAGRNGNIYQMQKAWEEVTVSYQIFAGERQAGAAVTDFTNIVEWLNSADDYAVLTDTYDPTHYRMAVFVDELEIESQWHTFGKATIRFRCRPERFIVSEPITVEDGDVITNSTKHIAEPLITLTGSGAHSLLNIDKSIPVYAYSMPYYQPAFSENIGWIRYVTLYGEGVPGINFYGTDYATSQNSSITTHNNTTGTLTFTSWTSGGEYYGVGTAVSCNPNTDYTVSCNVVNGTGKIGVIFFASSGQRSVISNIFSNTASGAISFSFRTPAECGYMAIYFTRTDGAAASFSNIMLATGTEAKSFRPYVGNATNVLTVGDITLQFTANGFGEAVIDCERENLAIDGVDSNANSTVLDQYSNSSVDYLRLKQGENEITFSEDITGVTIDPKLWEL